MIAVWGVELLYSGLRRVLAFVFCSCSLLLVSVVQANNLPGQFSDELTNDYYDCQLSLQSKTTLSDKARVLLTLEAGSGSSLLQLEINKARIIMTTKTNGKSSVVGAVASGIKADTPYELTVIRRGTMLGLSHGNSLLFRGTAINGTGAQAAVTADKGWSVTESAIQRLEPVVFTDDFMRTAEEQGKWKVTSGKWALQSAWDDIPQGNGNKFGSTIFAQNPFAWIGVGSGEQPAICTTGETFWEDYTLTAAVNPAVRGAVGVLVNMSDAENGLLIRWSSANDRSTRGNQLTLYRLTAGKQTQLASSAGGYLPGQWYRFSVISTFTSVQVLVDGKERLSYKNPTPWRGYVGLYAEGSEGSVFDDISVYGSTLDTDILQELRETRISQRFVDDANGMKEWAVNPDVWQPSKSLAGLSWYPETLYGDHNQLSLSITSKTNLAGELTLFLAGNPSAGIDNGYRAVISLAGNPLTQTCTLYRGAKQLASKTIPVFTPNEIISIRLVQNGTQLQLEVDDEPVLQAIDPQPLTSGAAGYRLDGQAFYNAKDLRALSRNMLDYTFSETPADWYAQGTWMPSIRWSCQPQWSFLAGWSRGDAVLWHKKRFTGDQMIQAFLGMKMDYPRQHEEYLYTRYQGPFCVTICGDGKNPRNGYCGIYGAPDASGIPYQRIILLRNGVEVGSLAMPKHTWGETHRAWFILSLEKQGQSVTFTVKMRGETYTIPYIDSQPFDGGIPAVWTQDNAVSVARVRINCVKPPVLWAGPQVVVDTPWNPEWANIGQTETLHFPESFAQNGKPITLRVIPQNTPVSDKTADVQGTDVSITPKEIGDHWYTVTANEGANSSFPYEIDQKVFNPALGRDDSHALVLYRFDEGSGKIVHDRSTVTPPLDLNLPENAATASWVPGQGVLLQAGGMLSTTANADKLLLALAKTKACSLEFWVSTDTIISNMILLWWGDNWPQGNIGIAQSMGTLMTTTAGYTVKMEEFPGNKYYTSLHHYVITWDGKTTTAYMDGSVLWARELNWAPEKWTKRNQFILGQSFLGTYYMFALHDRSFTSDEIKRHYQAGPSAR